jgi:hypothetical protein
MKVLKRKFPARWFSPLNAVKKTGNSVISSAARNPSISPLQGRVIPQRSKETSSKGKANLTAKQGNFDQG